MNEIEKTFYDAFIDELVNPENKIQYSQEIHSQVVIGIYVVDFVVNDKYIIEIDGHEHHKTKAQRYQDYQRERYLISMGYIVIRFTGSEVFVDPHSCAIETLKTINKLTSLNDDESYEWYLKRKGGEWNGTTNEARA
jgi:very-short-patch-repair endonuclease